MSIWNCGICGEKHDSDIVGWKCPNQRSIRHRDRMGKDDGYKKRKGFYDGILWRNTRTMIIERDNGYCQRCYKLYGIYTYEHLQVHHIHKLELHWNKRLDADNLVTLCPQCHRQVDTGCKDGELDFEWEAPQIEYRIF